MADLSVQQERGPLVIRGESGKLFLPDEVGARIENMMLTEDATLRSVVGPCPLQPDKRNGGAPTFSRVHGVFHCLLQNGSRDILLLHSGVRVEEFQGWASTWKTIIGESAANPLVEAELTDDQVPRFPTQFVATPSGVIIIPQGPKARAYFYDGTVAAPFGFDERPAPPQPVGPQTLTDLTGSNSSGYHMDGGVMNPDFCYGRLGTARGNSASDDESGILERGGVRYAAYWLDYWGNQSALSGRSARVSWVQESANAQVDLLPKQVLVTSVSPGPAHCIGRGLARTQDELHSGTQKLFELPSYAAEGVFNFATLPDNVTTVFPDNIPDSWVFKEPLDTISVPRFKLACLAFGRCWVANTEADPGRLYASVPGRWGTFVDGDDLRPDPGGHEITGLHSTSAGLLAFTEVSTFLIVPSDDGQRFRWLTLSSTVGCVAPSSIQTMENGVTIWLGRGGFYGLAPASKDAAPTVSKLEDPDNLLRRLNKARRLQACAAVDPKSGEYRCWVPVDGALTNTLCIVYDGDNLRRRTDVDAVAVCVTRDHRQYVVAVSETVPTRGVWVLDHQQHDYTPGARTSMVETGWIRTPDSQRRGSPTTVWLWLRETQNASLTVEVMRDWRNTVLYTVDANSTEQAPLMYPADDTPDFWGTAELGAADTTWAKRRPYWRRVWVHIPDCEVFKLRLSQTTDWEFIGLSFTEIPHNKGGASTPP